MVTLPKHLETALREGHVVYHFEPKEASVYLPAFGLVFVKNLTEESTDDSASNHLPSGPD